jgi:hypothetical protein
VDFSDALKHLKSGQRMARPAWSGAGVTLALVPGITVSAPDGAAYRLSSVFALFSNNVGSPWSMPAYDILAEDWELVEVKEDVFA